MKVQPGAKARNAGDKRQNLPFILSCDCPECGAPWEADLSTDHYLSYPAWNEAYDLGGYCHECDAEWKIQIVPRVTLEVV